MLYQITAPYFCAAIIVEGETVTDAAPILGYMRKKNLAWVEEYCKKKRWRIALV